MTQDTAAAAPPRSTSPWIGRSWLDLALFVATPVLLIPLVVARRGSPGIQELILYLGAFGALGHHLPGMMRVYGDRALFARFRVRFIAAPVFLVSVCVFFMLNGLGGVVLITFLWTTWHTLMQIYGFARIYDAKAGSYSRFTSRLDQALCLAWIGAPIFFSDSRLAGILELYYRCGGPLLQPELLGGVRTAWAVGTAVVSAAFVANALLAWRAGRPPNPVKLLLFASSFSFWWFCMVEVDHLLVGVALFDIVHDVQYLGLVWLYNRQRADHDPGAGAFTRFLFRRSAVLVGLYVGLVAAYGSIGFLTEELREETFKQVLLGVLAASALLHFYFDGFIWKVRERSTRGGLGITGGTADFRMPGWLTHGLKWGLFAVPLALLGISEARSDRPEAEWRAAILEAAPGSAESLTRLGALRLEQGEISRALQMHRDALERKPELPEIHSNLGLALRMNGELDSAEAAFREALRLAPDFAKAHGHLANLLQQRGAWSDAERHYREAIRHDAGYADPRANLGALLTRRGELHEAVQWFRAALEIEPDNRGALNNLAWLLATTSDASLRDGPAALAAAERLAATGARPSARVLETLAAAYAATGRFEEALAAAERARTEAAASADRSMVERLDAELDLYRRRAALGEP